MSDPIRQFFDRDVQTDGPHVIFTFGSHGEAIGALNAARASIAALTLPDDEAGKVLDICQAWIADGRGDDCFWEGWPDQPDCEDLTPNMLMRLLASRAAAEARIRELEAELSASNEIGRAFEEDACQQRERAEAAEARIRELEAERGALAASDGEATRLMLGAQKRMREYKARAEAAEARNAALEAERDYTDGTNEVLRGENQRLEARNAALTAQVEKLRDGIDKLENTLINAIGNRKHPAWIVIREVRAAITEEPK